MEIIKNKLSFITITSIYIYVSLLYIVLYCLPKSAVLAKNRGNCKKKIVYCLLYCIVYLNPQYLLKIVVNVKNSFGCNR